MVEKIFIDPNLPERAQLVLEFLIRAALATIGGDGASVMLMDREGKAITIKALAGTGESLESKLGITLKVGERVAGHVAQTGEGLVIVGDVHKYKRFSTLKKYQDIKSGLCAPLKAGNKIMGVLNIKRTEIEEPLGQAEMKLVNTLAAVAAALLG